MNNIEIQVKGVEMAGQNAVFVCHIKDFKNKQSITHKVGFSVLYNLHKSLQE